MSRRLLKRAAAVTGIATIVALAASAKAAAGTDVFSNIAPASPLGSAARFLRYPLSHYGLDQHFTVISASITGGVSVSGLLPEIAWFFASITWLVTSFIAKVTIEIFAFAFNLDLVNGSAATGGVGALGPVSQAIHSIYANVFGAPWLVLAFSVVALWAMWRALVQRRYVETAGALALSLIYIVVAIFFVAEPGQTIGQASRWTNEMSQAFLSISDHGNPTGGEAATADDADQLWGLLVERPWSVLEFGGLEHCAVNGTGDEDSDPQSAAVRPLSRDAGENAALSKQLAEGTEVAAEGKTCINNANKYSSHFLRFGIGTDERNEEYDALNDGKTEKLPEADTEKAGYKLGVADKPATDAMEEGGQYQRLLIALIVAVGETGAFLLLGSLAIGVILSQILLLLLLAFSPVALVAAAIPGRGHDFFTAWLQKLAGYLLRKAAYSLVLAVLLAVNAAIADATSQLGWLFAFGLQAIFFWTVLIQRRTLTGGLIGIVTGAKSPGRDLALDAVALYGGARLGMGAVRGVGRAGGEVRRRRARRREEGRPSFGGTSTTKTVDWRSPSNGGGEKSDPAGGESDRGPTPEPDAPGGGGADTGGDARPNRGPGPKGDGHDGREDAGDADRRGQSTGAGTDPPKAGEDSSGDAGERTDRRDRPKPIPADQPDPAGDEPPAAEPAEAAEPKPARRKKAADSDGGGAVDGDDDRAARRARSNDRPRPEVRDAGESAGASTPGRGRVEEAGGGRSSGSPLRDELRDERKRVAPPASAADRREAPSVKPAAEVQRVDRPEAPAPEDQPTSPPRRRRRLWRRGR
jgi:hypothetical protein